MIPFVSRTQANAGKVLPLYSKDGKDYSLTIISVHSDAFKLRRAAILREAAQEANDGRLDGQQQINLTAKLAASTVTGWNLPDEFGEYTPEGAEKLLFDYPQICEAVDLFSSNDANFLEKKLKA
jgi:hypothetical protein